MEATNYNKLMILVLFLTLPFILGADGTLNSTLSKQDELELDRQLGLINKAAIKSFKTEDGEIYDCVAIYKQHAFDHPLLKNHTIQMRPTSVPKWVENNASTNVKYSSILPDNIECPRGTVRVKRIKREDLILAKKTKLLGYKNAGEGHYSAGIEHTSIISGASGGINLWSPVVSRDQYSLAGMWLANSPRDKIEALHAGWIVSPSLYGEVTHPRLFTFWTADNYQHTGCYNALCPGFVHVSTKTSPDMKLAPVSTYGGSQYSVHIAIYQDAKTRNWWFDLNGEHIGYWPTTLFTHLVRSATNVAWGGQVYSPVGQMKPQMGSGHFAKEVFGHAAYVHQIKAIRAVDEGPSLYNPSQAKVFADQPQCYNAIKGTQGQKDPWIVYTFFGGPGKCLF